MCGVHPMREKCRSNIWPKKKKKKLLELMKGIIEDI